MQFKNWKLFILLFLNTILNAQNIPNTKQILDFDGGYYIVQTTDGTWGLSKNDSKFVIEPVYDTLFPLYKVEYNEDNGAFEYFTTPYIIGRKGKEAILLDLNGKAILTADYITDQLFHDVVLVEKHNLRGLYKVSGEEILPKTCTQLQWFGDLMALKENEKWLLFHTKHGKLLADAVYDTIIEVQNESSVQLTKKMLLVQKNKTWGILNQDGMVVFPIAQQQIRTIQPNLSYSKNSIRFLIQKENKWGLFGSQNKILAVGIYDSLIVKDSDQAFLIFKRNNKWGVVDTFSKELIADCDKVEVLALEMGFNKLKIQQKGKWGVLNGYQGLELPTEYDDIKLNAVFFICKKGKQSIYIHRITKKQVPLPVHEETDYFSTQYAKIKINGKWGLVDFNGKIVVEPSYDYFSNVSYYDNRVNMGKNGLHGMIDSLGKVIIKPLYQQIKVMDLHRTPLQTYQKFFVVDSNKTKGLLDYNGKVLLYAQYTKLESESKVFNGYFEAEKAGKKGILKYDGVVVLPLEYDDFQHFKYNGAARPKDGFWKVILNEKEGLVEIKNDIPALRIPADFQSIKILIGRQYPVHDYYIVEQNNKFGVYNIRTQQLLLAIEYDQIEIYLTIVKDFKNLPKEKQQVFQTKKDGQTIFVDLEGKIFNNG